MNINDNTNALQSLLEIANSLNNLGITITSVTESTADGGVNVITFSDGTTLNIKNGSKGLTGEQGDKGEKGSMGVKGDKGTSIHAQYIFGHPDDGYSIDTKSINEGDLIIGLHDGYLYRVLDIVSEGQAMLEKTTLSIMGKNGLDATPVTPLFAKSIEQCTDTDKFYVLPDGYIYAYTEKEVSGEAKPTYTNQVPLSIDTNGTIYNGTGYKDNARLSSSGSVSGTAQTGSVVTGFIPFKFSDIIRMKGAEWLGATAKYNGHHFYIAFYDSNKTLLNLMSSETYGTGSVIMSVERDETTGVETFDLADHVGSNEWLTKVQSAAYFRINARGKGSDLIVTVNEEIKESSSSSSTGTVWEWTNTGHAFVPANYEDRIIDLEEYVDENAEAIAGLSQKVDGIMDGTTEIEASTKFDPTVYGLPVLYITGDISPISESKDNKVTVSYVYGERSGTCTLKGQGATSYQIAKELGKYGKFNYTIKFDNAFEAKEGWGEQTKYCLKANWIDHSHSRNVVSAKIWGQIVKSRSTANANLANLVNGGAVDGFPIVIMLNNEFHGLYTFNIPKDGWMFGMVEDTTKTQAFLGANDHMTATQFKGESAGNDADFELEFVSDEDNTDWVIPSLNRLINACINSDGSDLDTTVAQYLDWDSAIDYYIFIVVLKGTDMVDKNYLITTFDGVKWLFTAYDIDSTYGLNWDGSGLSRAVSNENFEECASTHRVWELIKKYKTAELKARYNELRSNILSETRICQYFENFAWEIPSPILIEDVKKYPSIHGSSVNGIDQICRWVRQRLETVDEWIKNV